MDRDSITPPITRSQYTPGSLLEDIDGFANRGRKSHAMIASVLLKLYRCFSLRESIESEYDYDDVADFFVDCQLLLSVFSYMATRPITLLEHFTMSEHSDVNLGGKSLIPLHIKAEMLRMNLEHMGEDDLLELWQKIRHIELALRMLGDQRQSVAMFEDVTRRPMDPRNFDGDFVGIDAGVGSGLLMIAQLVLALKSRFESITLFGIESGNETFSHLCHLMDQLPHDIRLIHGDAKKVGTFRRIIRSKRSVACITAELIPNLGAHPINAEGLITVLDILYTRMGDRITKNTEFFPAKVRARRKGKGAGKRVFTLSPNNGFLALDLIHETQDGEPLEKLVYAEEISINGKLRQLPEVGAHVTSVKETTDVKEARRWH